MSPDQLPPEFSVEFKVKHQTLEFNMIDDNDIELIIKGLIIMIENIQEMVQASNKSEYSETVFFPFEKHTDRDRASMIIHIEYRQAGAITSNRIKITQE